MLIVIVIIGILIAALMPRMQSAQWRARDVARKNDLSQIQTAIVTSQQDKWDWPGMEKTACDAEDWSYDDDEEAPEYECSEETNAFDEDYAPDWMNVGDIKKLLTTAWMSSVPTDPLAASKVSWILSSEDEEFETMPGQYAYIVTKRNGTENWWFLLMAKTEIEWWSNWAVCDDEDSDKDLDHWWIWGSTEGSDAFDLKNVHPCNKLVKVDEEDDECDVSDPDNCKYTKEWQLRYILTY